MKVYSVKTDIKFSQSVLPEIEERYVFDLLHFDCERKIAHWPEIDWYVFNPKEKEGDFYSLGGNGAFVFNQRVYDSELFDLLEMAGEILPIQLEDGGPTLYVLNVLECVNALDKKNTVFDVYDDGTRGRILQYAFHPNRITESPLYKIPETSKTEVLTYTGVKDPEDEFKTLYEQLDFSGLVFSELYAS